MGVYADEPGRAASAAVLADLGTEHALVVHGATASTRSPPPGRRRVAEVRGGEVRPLRARARATSASRARTLRGPRGRRRRRRTPAPCSACFARRARAAARRRRPQRRRRALRRRRWRDACAEGVARARGGPGLRRGGREARGAAGASGHDEPRARRHPAAPHRRARRARERYGIAPEARSRRRAEPGAGESRRWSTRRRTRSSPRSPRAAGRADHRRGQAGLAAPRLAATARSIPMAQARALRRERRGRALGGRRARLLPRQLRAAAPPAARPRGCRRSPRTSWSTPPSSTWAKAAGADAVLLIAALYERDELRRLRRARPRGSGLAPLVETHDAPTSRSSRARPGSWSASTTATCARSTSTSSTRSRCCRACPPAALKVAESGIRDAADLGAAARSRVRRLPGRRVAAARRRPGGQAARAADRAGGRPVTAGQDLRHHRPEDAARGGRARAPTSSGSTSTRRSPRSSTSAEAREIAGAGAAAAARWSASSSTRPPPRSRTIAGARRARPRCSSSGDEGPRDARAASRRARSRRSASAARCRATRRLAALPGRLLGRAASTPAPRAALYGGTGTAWDRADVARARCRRAGRVFVAGGIGPDNVAAAARRRAPVGHRRLLAASKSAPGRQGSRAAASGSSRRSRHGQIASAP